MLISTKQLNPEQMTKLEQLCALCKCSDGNIIPIYRHLLTQQRLVPGNILFYHQQQLIGFLSIFFFYEETCEIAIMVDPNHRRQGIATTMLKQVLPLLKAEKIKNLIFSVATGREDNWLLAHDFHYEQSEYEMSRHTKEKIASENNKLQVRLATSTDIESLVTIDNACFFNRQRDVKTRLNTLLNDPAYSLFIATLDGIAIGKTHIHWREDNARFSDIAILPFVQGQGYGRALLIYCINYVLNKQQSHIVLDVETRNQNALNLYSHLGFTISNACDYWTISLEKMAEI